MTSAATDFVGWVTSVANRKIEDGKPRDANELFDALIHSELTKRDSRVALVVI